MRKGSIFTFDLILTWHVTFQEKVYVCSRNTFSRLFQRRLARLAYGWDAGQAHVERYETFFERSGLTTIFRISTLFYLYALP